MEYVTQSELATGRLAAALLPHLSTPDTIALEGDLGAGKTAFARALIRAALGADTEVPSPTFTLVQTYQAAFGEIWHFDLYRLARAEDAYELGIEDAFATAVCLVEWPDRLVGHLPINRLEIQFNHTAWPDHRRICLTGHGTWETRLHALASFEP